MSDVGFRVSADISNATSSFRRLSETASEESAKTSAAIGDISKASSKVEESLGKSASAQGSMASYSERLARIFKRDLLPSWDRIHGPQGARDLRASVVQVERYHNLLRDAGQAKKRMAEVDWDAGGLKEHEEAIKRVHRAWGETLGAPRNRRLREELRGYGAEGASPHDVLNTYLPMIYGSGASRVARRLMSDTAFRVGDAGVMPPVAPPGIGAAAEGDTTLATGALLSRVAGPLKGLAAPIAGLLSVGAAVSAASESLQTGGQIDMLRRRLTGQKGTYEEFKQGLFDTGKGLGVTRAETMALEQQFLGGSRGLDDAILQYGTRESLGLARGIGSSPEAAVGAMSAFGYWKQPTGPSGFSSTGERKAEQRDFAQQIAFAIGSSRAWEQSDKVMSALSDYLHDTGARSLTMPDVESWLAMLSAGGTNPLTGGEAGIRLSSQVDAAIRGGGAAGMASKVFGMDALAKYGVNGAYDAQWLIDQGMYTQIPGAGGKTVLDAQMERFRSMYGTGESRQKSYAMGSHFGITGPQAQEYEKTWSLISEKKIDMQKFQDWMYGLGGMDMSQYKSDAMHDLTELYINQPDSAERDLQAQRLMKHGREPTEGSEFQQDYASMKNAMSTLGDELAPMLAEGYKFVEQIAGNTSGILDYLRGLDAKAGFDMRNLTKPNTLDEFFDRRNMEKMHNPGEVSDLRGLTMASWGGGGGGRLSRASYSGAYSGGGHNPIVGGEWRAYLSGLEKEHGLPAGLLSGIEAAETGHIKNYDRRRKAVSPAGAQGWFQFMPETWAQHGKGNVWDPKDAARGSANYLAHIRDYLKSRGIDPTPENMAAAYNAGEGAVVRQGGIPNNDETRGYVPRVMAGMETAQRIDVTVTVLDKDGKVLPSETAPVEASKPRPWGGGAPREQHRRA